MLIHVIVEDLWYCIINSVIFTAKMPLLNDWKFFSKCAHINYALLLISCNLAQYTIMTMNTLWTPKSIESLWAVESHPSCCKSRCELVAMVAMGLMKIHTHIKGASIRVSFYLHSVSCSATINTVSCSATINTGRQTNPPGHHGHGTNIRLILVTMVTTPISD